MVVTFMTNSQMGISYFEGNRFLFTNYCQNQCWEREFLILGKPIYGIGLNVKKSIRIQSLGLRAPNLGNPIYGSGLNSKNLSRIQNIGGRKFNLVTINALSKEGLIGGGVIEKEVEFKPFFDDYLKAMESIRTGREKKQSKNSSENKSNEVSNAQLLEKDEEKAKPKKSKFIGKGEQNVRLKKWEQIEKDEISEDSLNLEEKGMYGIRRDQDSKASAFGRENYNLAKENVKVKNLNMIGKGEENVKLKWKLVENDELFENSSIVFEENGTYGSKRDQSRQVSAFESEQYNPRGYEMRGKYVRSHVQVEKVADKRFELKKVAITRNRSVGIESDSDGDFEMERAAFKQFGGVDDVHGKSRISRVEMEERIQKLAKCLNGADIDMPEWMFTKMIRSARIRFSDHSILRVIQILGKLGNWRRVLQVIEWLQVRERFKSHKIRFIYTAALNVLGKTRRPVEALNLFLTMQKQMSTYPDLVAYHSIAVTLGQAGHMKELFDVMDNMRAPRKKFKSGLLEKWDPRLEPDIVVYNAVLNACGRRKQWEGAFWVLQQLKQQGLRPTSVTYGLVMEVMLACGKYDLVHEFFKKVQKSSIPNALTYKVIVNTLWKEGKTEEAIATVHEMERRGIVGSAGLYYDLARCLCSAGRCQEALNQIEKICKVANKPLVVTYTGLIQACLDAGNIQNGVRIFTRMQESCSPNLVTCNIMLKAYLEHKMFEDANELFKKMLEGEIHVTGEAEFKNRVVPDIYTFNTMLDACVDEKRWDDFEYVYKQMLHHGYHFNAKRHLRMVLDASRAGKGVLVETTWNHLGATDRIPPPPLIKERFCIKLENQDIPTALSCITSHPTSESYAFSKKVWLNFLEENIGRFSKDSLISLIHEATTFIAKRDLPNIMLHNLVAACREFLRID